MYKNINLETYKFNDPELDNIKNFDHIARSALINREITKKEYIAIENTLDTVRNLFFGNSKFSREGKSILRDCLAGY